MAGFEQADIQDFLSSAPCAGLRSFKAHDLRPNISSLLGCFVVPKNDTEPGFPDHMPPRLITSRRDALDLLKQCVHVRWGTGFDPTKDRISCPEGGKANLLEVMAEGGLIGMFSAEQNAFVGVSRVIQIPPGEITAWSYDRWPIGIPVEILAVFRSLPVKFGEWLEPEMRPYFGMMMHGRGISTITRLKSGWLAQKSG